ncbi:PD-(D/E)XK motif protein [Xanthomonas cerealis]|nr:PD-(D/E)XK motif protein [Xanthomonas translucens]
MHEDPWKGLTSAIGQIVGRRVSMEHPLDAFWIKGADGSPGLLLRGIDPLRVPDQLPKPRGLVLHTVLDSSRAEASMFLREHEDREVFLTLCKDVISYSGGSATPADATSSLFRRLAHWHSLMTRGRTAAMSPHEVRGLVGELFVMERLAASAGFAAALNAWVAPDEHPQDFACKDRLLEVKSRLSGSRQVVRISSLAQLEPAQLPLTLVVVELVASEGADAVTLNQICARLTDRARSFGPQMVDQIEAALFKRGYIHLEAYDSEAYRVAGMAAFECRDGFPRLIRSEVDARIQEAKYTVDLALIGEFAVSPESVLDSGVDG